jgi:phage baseplate assembly protein W|tara:strand:+ start:1828 stop:2286 length:459 start_codon:yes stop_codon:yes gene_type:complete
MANVVKYSALGIPFGMSYPLTFGTDTKTFGQIMEYGTTVKNNLRNLLLTQKGEKDMDQDFGTNLHGILFEYQVGDSELEAAINDTINQAVEKYMPGVIVNSLVVEPKDNHDGAVVVKIDFQADFSDPANLEFTVTPDGGAEDSAGGVTSTLL